MSVEIKPVSEGELSSFLQDQAPDQQLVWVSVGLTRSDWRKQAGGDVVEQGVFVNTNDGVWMIGLCGAILIGTKSADGTIIKGGVPFKDVMSPDMIILEYADGPAFKFKLKRDERGAIVFPPEDDPWWDI